MLKRVRMQIPLCELARWFAIEGALIDKVAINGEMSCLELDISSEQSIFTMRGMLRQLYNTIPGTPLCKTSPSEYIKFQLAEDPETFRTQSP